MRPVILALGLSLLLSGVLPAHGDTLELDYGSLYSHTRKLDKDNMPALQFAFGFQHQQHDRLCRIDNAVIQTQKQDIVLHVTPEQRFIIPSERALKLAEATVKIDLQDKIERCDMSVQLETTAEYLKSSYKLDELRELQRQYAEFFGQIGSFMSFLMPSVQGLIIHFEQQPSQAVKVDGRLPAPEIINHELRLSNQWLQEQDLTLLQLPVKPRRIIAWVE